MVISKQTKRTVRTMEKPSIRVNHNGHIIMNKAAAALLEIEDKYVDGVVFGYDAGNVFIAWSTDPDAYRCGKKKCTTSFMFGSKYESKKIFSIFNNTDKSLIVRISEENVKVIDGYKFYKLIKC